MKKRKQMSHPEAVQALSQAVKQFQNNLGEIAERLRDNPDLLATTQSLWEMADAVQTWLPLRGTVSVWASHQPEIWEGDEFLSPRDGRFPF